MTELFRPTNYDYIIFLFKSANLCNLVPGLTVRADSVIISGPYLVPLTVSAPHSTIQHYTALYSICALVSSVVSNVNGFLVSGDHIVVVSKGPILVVHSTGPKVVTFHHPDTRLSRKHRIRAVFTSSRTPAGKTSLRLPQVRRPIL